MSVLQFINSKHKTFDSMITYPKMNWYLPFHKFFSVMKLALLVLMTAFLLLSFSAYAETEIEGPPLSSLIVQPFQVKGKVSDQGGVALSGVSIKLKGSNMGATTDANGLYSISVPNGNASLVFSYLGFISQDVAVGGRTTVNVELLEESTGLSEVIVTDRKSVV